MDSLSIINVFVDICVIGTVGFLFFPDLCAQKGIFTEYKKKTILTQIRVVLSKGLSVTTTIANSVRVTED